MKNDIILILSFLTIILTIMLFNMRELSISKYDPGLLNRRLSSEAPGQLFLRNKHSVSTDGSERTYRRENFRRRRKWKQNFRTTVHKMFDPGFGNSLNTSIRNPPSANTNATFGSFAESLRNSVENDVSPLALLACVNQTRCITPKLQLRQHFNVYYCKHVGHGVRFYFLIREGLLLHPNIHFVSRPEDADIVVYLPVSADWHKTECNKPLLRNKTVVLDEGDYPQLFSPEDKAGDFLLYFKRSFVRRSNGIFHGYMNYVKDLNVLPMTYTIMEAYVRNTFMPESDRDLEILCTLRGSSHDPVRLRVRQWVQEYSKARGVNKFAAKEVNFASRTVVSTDYFQQMQRSQIIVTSNPSNWEGDFRLCEAMASGALIFVDHMYVPRPSPLLDGQHFILYDNNNKTDLFEKLDKYRSDKQAARKVAVTGYLHAMRNHRAANLVDYVFRSLQLKINLLKLRNIRFEDSEAVLGRLSGLAQVNPDGYTDTGFHLRLLAAARPSSKKRLFQE